MILVNGCSYTYGDELQSPEQERWSTYLGKHLDKDVLNIAAPGSSNAKIYRDTMDKLISIHRRGDKLDGIIIMWSAFERVEVISLATEHNYDADLNLINEPFVQVSPARLDGSYYSIKRNKEAWETFYGEIYTRETGIVNTVNYMSWIYLMSLLMNCECIQLWFHEGNKYNFNRTFIQSRLNNQGPRLQRIYHEVINKLNSLPGKCKVGFNDRYLTFNEFTTTNKYPRMPEGHPGPQAHKEYALYLKGMIDTHNLFRGE